MLDYLAPMLKPLADDVWTLDLALHSTGMHLPVRTTIVRLPNGDLIVYSPFELDEATAKALDDLGRVAWLVGPNTYHHLKLRKWQERWPSAELWATAALQKKRPDLKWSGVLGEGDAPAAWAGLVDHVVLAGAPKMGEVALFHRSSGTALVCDLVFNVPEPQGFFLRLFMRVTGVFGRFRTSRMWKFLVKDRARMHEDVERILAWDIRRVVMAHGDVVEHDAHARFVEALAWLRASPTRAALGSSGV
jgi:hypothetical protein